MLQQMPVLPLKAISVLEAEQVHRAPYTELSEAVNNDNNNNCY